MKRLCRVFFQAMGIVTLTALNVVQVSQGRYLHAVVVGCGISALWWANSKASRPEGLRFHVAYTVGAGCGTLLGMFIGRLH